MGDFFTWLSTNSIATEVFTAVFVIVLPAAVIFFVIAFFQGREIQIFSFRIGPHNKIDVDRKAKNSIKPSIPFIDARLTQVSPPVKNLFETVELPSERPPATYYDWEYAPLGVAVFYNVPFYLTPVRQGEKILGHNTLEIKPKGYNRDIKDISVKIAQLSKVHFLLSAKNGYSSMSGRRIGYIEFFFEDDTTEKTEIVLGKNIRESEFGLNANLINTADFNYIKPAWVDHYNLRRIDFLSINIRNTKDLVMMRIAGFIEPNRVDENFQCPSIIVSAITCEKHE